MAYDANDLVIKQIQASNGLHELDAKYFDGHKWSDVTDLVEAGFEATIMTTLPTITSENYNTYRNTLALKADENAEAGTYLEYIVVKEGSTQTPTYTWEQIGSTKTNFTIPTEPSVTLTVSTASTTVHTTNNGGQTATGNASIAYDKATSIGSAGGATAAVEIIVDKLAPTITGSAGGANIKNTSQLAASTVDTTEDGSHTHSVTTTAHSHTVHLTSSSKTVVTNVTKTGGAGAHTHSISVSSSSTPVIISASVNNNILSFSTANVISSINAASATGEAGSHIHSITPITAIINYITGATLAASAPSGTATSAGTHSHNVTIAAHSHTYVELKAHTHAIATISATYSGDATISEHSHTINYTTTTVTGTASVAVASHTHNVVIPAHTHTVTVPAHNHSAAAGL